MGLLKIRTETHELLRLKVQQQEERKRGELEYKDFNAFCPEYAEANKSNNQVTNMVDWIMYVGRANFNCADGICRSCIF